MCIQDHRIAARTRSDVVSATANGTAAVLLVGANAGRKCIVVATVNAAQPVMIGPLINGVVYPLGGIPSISGQCVIRYDDYGPIVCAALYIIGPTFANAAVLGHDISYVTSPEDSVNERS